MSELLDPHKITAAHTLHMLTLQEAQLRELAERVGLQDDACAERQRFPR